MSLETVLENFRNAGYFRNLHRYDVKLVRVIDDAILSYFPLYNNVYYLPADFGSLETISDNFVVEFYNNFYWLCVRNNCCFNGFIDYSVKPDYNEFSWCDPSILHSIVTATATKIKAFDTGKDFEYMSQESARNLGYARKIRTKRGGHLKTSGYFGNKIW